MRACLDSGRPLAALLLSRSAAGRPDATSLASAAGLEPIVLADPVFAAMADADTPSGIAAEIALPEAAPEPGTLASCVFLEAVQDAGNVGAILRSAAAFGIAAAVLGPGCADPWSPKVLRAAMGAHFRLPIGARADLAAALDAFGGRLLCAEPRGGVPLPQADLSGRVGWLFGSEGQGVSPALAARAALRVTIPMPGGMESLNVAACAAVCFYEFSRRDARS